MTHALSRLHGIDQRACLDSTIGLENLEEAHGRQIPARGVGVPR